MPSIRHRSRLSFRLSACCCASLLCLGVALWVPAATAGEDAKPARASAGTTGPASSKQLEKELQGLSWHQFQAVVKAVPKLREAVDAYGPLGWQYVQMNYQTYGWKKNIDKLDAGQRQELLALIGRAKNKQLPTP